MKTILALSFFPAFLPPRSGGEVRLFGLYNALSEHCRVILLTSGNVGEEVERLSHNANFQEIRLPKGGEFGEKWTELQPHAGSGDLSAPCLAALSSRFGSLHQHYLENYEQADIIIHDSPFLVGYDLFLGFDKKPRIYNSYNVETDVYSQLHKDNESQLIPDLVRECEAQLCAHAQVVTVCSQEDGTRFQDLFAYEGRIELVPNGIDGFQTVPPSQGDRQLVFIGSGHLPNVLAARFIIDELAPALPDYEFHIIGRCGEAISDRANVTLHGPVDEERKKAIFRSALACVNPMVEGGGSSLKITDLAAHGVPVISTPMGVRGFDYIDDVHYIAADAEHFAEVLPTALADRTRLIRIANNAAQHIRTNFTWSEIAERMNAAILASFEDMPPRTVFAVLNDYDPFEAVGGGATRIQGLYDAVSEQAKVILLCFTDHQYLRRRETFSGRMLVLGIPKTAAHRQEEAHTASLHHISVADILAIRHAPENPILFDIYKKVDSFVDLTLCEHPYLVGLPQRQGNRFVYSSQNFELGLKREMLAWHPLKAQLLDDVARAESFAVGCSELVVAVSDDDARILASAFPLSAPVVTVPNGASEPLPMSPQHHTLTGRNVVFLGSAHMPNVEAGRFILEELAPRYPDVTFHLAGTVCSSLGQHTPRPANVHLWGLIDDQWKADLLGQCDLALNPMSSGSGSNVKVADYLKNGLAVLSTTFGARGYEKFVGTDIHLCEISAFGVELQRMLATAGGSAQGNAQRRERFVGRLSMYDFGKDYAALLQDKLVPRPRALFTTYRYNDPALGGGEVHLNRLIRFVADAGFDVDVVAPAVTSIYDRERFTSEYVSPEELGDIPVGNPRISTARFPLSTAPDATERLTAIWQRQPTFERALFLQFAENLTEPGPAWGWAPFDGAGRWTYNRFGISFPRGGTMQLKGWSPARRYLRISTGEDALLNDVVIDGAFAITVNAPAGILEFSIYAVEASVLPDVRPLGAYIQACELDNLDIVRADPIKPWVGEEPHRTYHAMAAAAAIARSSPPTPLTAARGPFSDPMDQYLKENMSRYDLLITHNAVFRTAVRPIELAQSAGVPSILVPLLHLEDDYYHFPDVLGVCADADLTLVSPRAACDFLKQRGCNVEYHTPGVDLPDGTQTPDIQRFRKLIGFDEPFFLVLGRKSAAKGYRDVIKAVGALRAQHAVRLVLIGADDDRQPIREDYVTYLGNVDQIVVEAALAECVGLVNMSVSESFGMVLVEAGAAGKPVIANAACASFADIVEDGRNGYLVTPDTLLETMEQLFTKLDLRDAMGAAGREMAQRFDWQVIGKAFVAQCLTLARKQADINELF